MSESGLYTGETTAEKGWFKTTHWSAVLDARGNDTAQAEAALAKLCQTYWFPIYSYIRQLGKSPEDAQDLTQDFFARLLEKEYLKAVQPERGKFRSFVLMVLKRFLANEHDRANRQKRGGGQEMLSLSVKDTEAWYQRELVDDWTPEKAYDRRWATTVLEQVNSRLAAEMAASGKATVLEELKDFLTGEKSERSYEEVARRLEMTEGTLRVTIHRLRHRYRELLRLEIAHTVDGPEAIDDEIRYLFAARG